MKRISVVLLFFISAVFIVNLIFTGLCSARQDRSGEVNKYINMLESNSNRERINASKMITRSGLSDPKLFNIINERLLNIDRSRLADSGYVDELSWYCKALASSGRWEYKETLKTVILTGSNSKLKHYARQSLGLIEKYLGRNTLMEDLSNAPAGQSPEVTRYVNMLRSGDDSLIKDVAKELYRSPSMDPVLFEVANEVLLDRYLQDTHIDTMAWLCKALGASGNPVYKRTLEKVIDSTSSAKLKRYARKSLGMLD